MALQTKGRPQQKRSVRRRAQQPFNVLSSPYANQRQFDKAVNQKARAEYKPALGDVNNQRRVEDQTHLGRTQDISSWYGNWERNLQDAARGTSDALNKLIATREGTSRAAQGSLSAALRATDEAAQARARALGVDPAVSQTQGLEQAAYGVAESGGNNLAGNVASMINSAQQRTSLASLGAIQASRHESARDRNVQENLSSKRSEIVARIPEAREKARESLYQQALAQQNQGFQQVLAGKQFGLSKEQLGLQREQLGLEREKFGHQKAIDWANVDINRAQLDNERARIQAEMEAAGTQADKEAAKARAQRWDNASNWFASYLAPGDSETVQVTHGDKKFSKLKRGAGKRNYDQAFRILTVRFGLDRKDAFRMLSTATIPGWRRRAIAAMKPRGIKVPGTPSDRLDPSIAKPGG